MNRQTLFREPLAKSGANRLATACGLVTAAGRSRLTRSSWRTWPHRKLRRKVPRVGAQGGWRFYRAAQGAGRRPGAQRIRVVDAVAARQRKGDQRQHLVPPVGPPWRAAEVEAMVDEFPQVQVPGEGARQEQAGIGHQAVVVKDDADPVGIVLWQHLVS